MPQEITNKDFKLEEEILAPYTHLLQIKGKQLRVKIAVAFNHWLRLPDDKLHQVVAIVTQLHIGTLLFDDIQDNAELRRAIPAAHRVFGIPLTINTAIHVLFLVLEKVLKLHPKAAEIYAEEMLDALRGQGSELYWRDNFLCPTEEDHKNMATRKTGRMFTLGVRLCQLFSEYKTDLCPLALLLGLYFQIRDDYCNLIQQEELEEWPGVEDNIQELLSPYHHIQQVKGKHLRVKIILAFNHWLKVPEENLQYALEAFNLLHNGGLLIDDIQDHTLVRRGLPAAHCVYGLPLTINASLHVFVLALEKFMNISPKAGKIYSEHVLDVIRGQGLEVYWRDNFICPTEEEFKDMVQRKTASSYVMAVRTLQLFSEDQTDYTEFIKLLGLYYQIREDYCNLSQQEALDEWPSAVYTQANEATFCEDLTEGKFTLPIIHALQTSEGGQILNILRQRTRDVEVKKYCLSLLEKVGSLQYTRDVLQGLDSAARQQLARFGGNPKMEAVLDDLLSWKDQKAFGAA